MEVCGIDQEVNICIIKMTLPVDGSELKIPENGQKTCDFNGFAYILKMVQASHGGKYL